MFQSQGKNPPPNKPALNPTRRDRKGPKEARKTHRNNFYRLLLHALRPGQLGSFFRFARPQQDLQPLLDIVHEIFSGIGIVQQVLPYDEFRHLRGGPPACGWARPHESASRCAPRSIGGRTGGVIGGCDGRRAEFASRRVRVVEGCCEDFCGGDDTTFGGSIDLNSINEKQENRK